MNPSPQSQSCDSYRPDIDGLRAIAVISVVFFHGFPSWVKGGYTGVDIFFVISGYLISSTIYSGLQNNNFSFYAFYSSRIMRIMPALLLVLFSIYILGWFILSAYEYQQLGKHISAGAFFISNFVLWGESGYFDASAETKLLLHLWSLGIEEQFYIFWPLVLWAAWKVFGKKHWVVFIILIISFSLNVIGIRQDIVGTFYSPLTRVWELLSGGILAWLMFHKNNILQPPKKGETINLFDKYILFKIQENRRIPLLNAISILGILLLLFSLWITSKASGFPGHLAVLSVLGTVLVISAGPDAWANRIILSNKALVWIGLISYPLYLWHWPLLTFPRIIYGETPDLEIRLLAIALSFVFAFATYYFIESPIRWRKRRGRLSSAILLALTFLAGGVGYYTYINKGLDFRSMAELYELRAQDLNFELDAKAGWLCDTTENDIKPQCHFTGDDPSVVVIGDSHAPRIYSGLMDLYREKGKDIALFGGGGGCPPLIDVVSKDSLVSDDRNCLEKTTKSFLKIINDNRIKEVILVSRGPIYVLSKGFGEVDGNKFNDWILHFANEPPKQRTNSEVFMLGFDRTLDALIKSGKKVTYLHNVPELGFDIRKCINRSFNEKHISRLSCSVSRDLVERRNHDFRVMVDMVLSKYPMVRAIDLADALCDGSFCYGSKDDVLLYTDGDHLSNRGSSYIVGKLSGKFD